MRMRYNTDIQDALLTAAAVAMLAETGQVAIRMALESNGREPFADALDVTRTIGWFTAVAPVQLQLDVNDPPLRQLRQVKDQRRGLPGDGTAFDAARLWSSDAALRRSLAAVPVPTLGFNYLGRVDGETSRHGLFRPLPGSFGERRPIGAFSPHRVEMTSLVVDGRLVTEFLWSDPSDHGDVAARVAARYAAVLRALVADCLRLGGPGVTPSDFSMIAIDETALAAVLDEVERGEGPHSCSSDRRAALYLSPAQRGFRERLSSPTSQYIGRSSRNCAGFSTAGFEAAWRQVRDGTRPGALVCVGEVAEPIRACTGTTLPLTWTTWPRRVARAIPGRQRPGHSAQAAPLFSLRRQCRRHASPCLVLSPSSSTGWSSAIVRAKYQR